MKEKVYEAIKALAEEYPNGVTIDDIAHQGFTVIESLNSVKGLLADGRIKEVEQGVFVLTNTTETSNVWDEITDTTYADREYVGFKDENPLILDFESDTPTKITTKYGNELYMFNVIHNEEKKTFSTSSKRLMNILKQLRPLTGKTLRVKRKGEGFDTFYEVDVL